MAADSISTLLIGLPLVLVNLLSASASYRTLVHHYSLPLAVVAVVGCIDGLRRKAQPQREFPWMLCWTVVCWFALAKPWFFTGPYLSRLPQLQAVGAARALIHPQDAVLTTSYLVPQFSQRISVSFPKTDQDIAAGNVLLLNPSDPGWGSSPRIQERLLTQAKARSWTCRRWLSGLELCRDPAASKHE